MVLTSILNVDDITARYVLKEITVKGIVQSVKEPQLIMSIGVFHCLRCGNEYKMEQDSIKVKEPPRCECLHRDFEIVPDKSTFLNWQEIELKSEIKGSGKNLLVRLKNKPVNKFIPNQKVELLGTLRVELVKGKPEYFLDA